MRATIRAATAVLVGVLGRRLLVVVPEMFLNTFSQRRKRHPRRITVIGRNAFTLLPCGGLRRPMDPLLLPCLFDLNQFAGPLLIFHFPKQGFADRPLFLRWLPFLLRLFILTAVAVADEVGGGGRRHGFGPVFSSTNPCILYIVCSNTL